MFTHAYNFKNCLLTRIITYKGLNYKIAKSYNFSLQYLLVDKKNVLTSSYNSFSN